MIIKYEVDLGNFEFWSGGKDTADCLESDDWGKLEYELSDNEWDETELNDFFWYERDKIAEILGYSDWDDLVESRENEEENEDN